jgi:hypothetical protein
MGIPIDIMENERNEISRGIREGAEYGARGDYNEALSCYDSVRIAAGRLVEIDREIGEMLGLDRMVLAAKACQLKIYAEMLESGSGNRREIVSKMGEIAKGDVTEDNPHMAEILNVMELVQEGGLDALIRIQGRSSG